VFYFDSWRSKSTDPDLPIQDYLGKELDIQYPGHGTIAGIVFLLDEAQGSHWDQGLWLLLKSRSDQDFGPYFVLFTSYGSPGRQPVVFSDESAPASFARAQRVSLRSSLESSEKVFLFLDAEEFADMVERFCQCCLVPISLDGEVREYIYSLTAGHAGCVRCLLKALRESSVCMPLVDCTGLDLAE